MSKGRRQSVRKPAIKFPHLRKKMQAIRLQATTNADDRAQKAREQFRAEERLKRRLRRGH
jgi:hypothetical protein